MNRLKDKRIIFGISLIVIAGLCLLGYIFLFHFSADSNKAAANDSGSLVDYKFSGNDMYTIFSNNGKFVLKKNENVIFNASASIKDVFPCSDFVYIVASSGNASTDDIVAYNQKSKKITLIGGFSSDIIYAQKGDSLLAYMAGESETYASKVIIIKKGTASKPNSIKVRPFAVYQHGEVYIVNYMFIDEEKPIGSVVYLAKDSGEPEMLFSDNNILGIFGIYNNKVYYKVGDGHSVYVKAYDIKTEEITELKDLVGELFIMKNKVVFINETNVAMLLDDDMYITNEIFNIDKNSMRLVKYNSELDCLSYISGGTLHVFK